MAAVAENNGGGARGNGEHNGVKGLSPLLLPLAPLSLARLVSKIVLSLEASTIFASKVVEFLGLLAPRCQNTR